MKNKILLLLLIILIIPLNIKAVVEKSDKEYVTDQADILTDESEDYILKYSSFLYKTKQIDFYVVTVETLEGKEIEEYADEIIKEYKMNSKSILILYSKEDSKIRIQTGEKLNAKIDEVFLANYIKKYFMPYLERYEYNDGIMNGYNALYKYICKQYGIDASSMETIEKLDFLTKYANIIIVVLIWLAFIIGGRYVKYFIMQSKGIIRSIAETIELGSIIIFNILLIALAYLVKPVYIILVLASEFIAFFSSISRYKAFHKNKKHRLRTKSYIAKKKVYKKKRRKY